MKERKADHKKISESSGDSTNKDGKTDRDIFEILISIQIFLTFFALFYAWTLQYKNAEGNPSLIQRISFRSVDAPWTPPGTISTPILHLHHFGDWTLALAYSRFENPYDPNLAIPANIPPFGMFILKAFSMYGDKLSFILVCTITFIIWIYLGNTLLRNVSVLLRIVALLMFVLLSLPSIYAFDRGAVHLCLMGLVGISLIDFQNQRYKRSMLLMLVAISFKPYLVILSFWVIRELPKPSLQKWISLTKFWILIIVINVYCLSFFSTNIISGINHYILAISQFSRSFIIPWVMDSASLMGFLSKTVQMFSTPEHAEAFLKSTLPWSTIIVGVFLMVVLAGVLNIKTPKIVAIPLLLSMTSVIAPPSMEYTLVWASLAMLYILSELQSPRYQNEFRKFSRIHKLLFGLLISAIYLIVTPYFGSLVLPWGDLSRLPGSYLYFPFIFFSALLTFLASFIKKSALLDKIQK